MSTNVSVIVSKCNDEGRIFGDRLFDEKYPTVEEARAIGLTKCADGVSVIIRPNYNETDSEGRHFREWRSFNGAAFKECRFAY